MRRILRGVAFLALSAGVLFLPVACLLDIGAGVGAIRLSIGEPSTRMVWYNSFDVTEVKVEVYDPNGEWLDEVWWTAGDGTAEYLIITHETGDHELVITHYGTFEGEDYDATEYGYAPIEPGVITQVYIIPGAIGVIDIGDNEGGGCEPPVLDPPITTEVFGTWAGYNDLIAGGDGGVFHLWIELTFQSDGYAQMFSFWNEGDTEWLSDVSMRGVYTDDGTTLTGVWTEIWAPGWQSMCDGDWETSLETFGDPWVIPIDFSGDGVPDVVWEFTRQ